MENLSEEPKSSVEAVPTEVMIDQDMLERYMESRRQQQSLPLGIIAGVVAVLLSGILWAAITVMTEYQIGYMAIAIGFIVGFAVRFAGRGIETIYGVVGALLALMGCLLGNVLSIIGFLAQTNELGYVQVLSIVDFTLIPGVMLEVTGPIDLLFYALAIYFGFKTSVSQVTEEEVVANASK